MKRLVLESSALLLYFEWIMCLDEFNDLCRVVRDQLVRPTPVGILVASDQLCRAMDFACVFYFKHVLCLQRSAATTLLLRRYGWDAEMVIGAQVLPFKSHAWVEIKGTVINDRPYVPDIYQVLDRC